MANKRVIYSSKQIGLARDGTTTYIEAHGVQSVGITTNFNLEQVFELGQLSIYASIEQIPDIEVTIDKVGDGYPWLYHLATNGATIGTLLGRSNVKTTVAMSVFSDTSDSASGVPVAEVSMSGMVLSSWSFAAPVAGNVTESVTLIGNNKIWRDDETLTNGIFTGRFNNLDTPMNSGRVLRRENMVLLPPTGATTADANGAVLGPVSVFPRELYGITSSGVNPVQADGSFLVPLQDINVSCDLGRDVISEQGRKTAYARFLTVPVEVRTEIEVLMTKWDNVSASELGGTNGAPVGNNTSYQTIRLRYDDGTNVNLGTKNKLTNVALSGGDAGGGGGNTTLRYSYVTFNDMILTHPADPSGL